MWEIFFWLCGLSGALIGMVYAFGARQPKGMTLRLRAGTGPTKLRNFDGPPEQPLPFHRPPPAPQQPPHRQTGFRPSTTERPLNVMFNYNGETWDAYEVLGLPAGSSLERADEAYKKACAGVDPTSRGFIEAAHRAVVEQWRTYQKASGS